jgi:hypothetical protein
MYFLIMIDDNFPKMHIRGTENFYNTSKSDLNYHNAFKWLRKSLENEECFTWPKRLRITLVAEFFIIEERFVVITRQLQSAEVLSKLSSFVKVPLAITKQLVLTKQLKLYFINSSRMSTQWIVQYSVQYKQWWAHIRLFVTSLPLPLHRYIVSNDRYKRTPSVICL